jgi:hypothetical protein
VRAWIVAQNALCPAAANPPGGHPSTPATP